MSHFAKVKDGVVQAVIVAEQPFIDSLPTEDGVTWVQTSYNTHGGVHYKDQTRVAEFENEDGTKETITSSERVPDGGVALRKNFAGVGCIYDPVRDAFYGSQPFASWTLNEETCLWDPPVAMPSDQEKDWVWDETNRQWVEYT